MLSNPVALRMAKILGITDASTAPKCLACHALDVPPADRARTFDLADGVSCESCHGPASNWLGPHATKGWMHQQSIDAGMYDERDLIHRSEKCLGCHLGAADKVVDHEMIAAGHPDLYFELASFSAVMPKHWAEPKKDAADDVWIDVRALAVGQAVQLREELRRVARDAQSANWPEYSDLDCIACHHSLTSPQDSWRQQLGYASRRPGNPPWNLSRYVILRAMVADDRDGAQLSSAVDRVYRLMGASPADRGQIAARAAECSEIAARVAVKLRSIPLDSAAALRLLKNISADADYISSQDERAGEQAAMALDSLWIAYQRISKTPNDAAMHDAIHALFKQLEDPSSYSAPKFAQQMRVVNGLLK